MNGDRRDYLALAAFLATLILVFVLALASWPNVPWLFVLLAPSAACLMGLGVIAVRIWIGGRIRMKSRQTAPIA